MHKQQILIAAGGTGGHLFPAQALAHELSELGYRPLFAGAGLKTNPYFDRVPFTYFDVPSITPFGGVKALLKAPWILLRGVARAIKILKRERVSVVVGFGSYHTFPLLFAAKILKVPLVLFEPNAHPGKVNRLFSRTATFTALQFEEGGAGLKGAVRIVACPTRKGEELSHDEASAYFSLDPSKKTLLIFGGSQGAVAINALLEEIAPHLTPFRKEWQLLHFVGRRDSSDRVKRWYEEAGLDACVKPFEEKMSRAWTLADLVISRSGAATLAEVLETSTPALFIPFPHAADDHQTKNARVVEEVGGAITIPQDDGADEALLAELMRLMEPKSKELKERREALTALKEIRDEQHLSTLIIDMVENGHA